MEDKKISEEIKVSDFIKIQAFQSGGLVRHTRRLADLTNEFSNTPDVTCLATSVILMAAAAIEAVLVEAAYLIKPEIYADHDFQYDGVPEKFKKLMNKDLGQTSNDAMKLWKHRLALTHADPDLKRTRFVGEVINPGGALWAAETVENLAIKIWGAHMPKWFSDTTGLYRKT